MNNQQILKKLNDEYSLAYNIIMRGSKNGDVANVVLVADDRIKTMTELASKLEVCSSKDYEDILSFFKRVDEMDSLFSLFLLINDRNYNFWDNERKEIRTKRTQYSIMNLKTELQDVLARGVQREVNL